MPRMSHLLDWTRDLVASAAPPLVPPSAYVGGALVAADSQGHSAPLTLRKYHIDVHIEDGFARTTIDQTYFNHTLGRLEGTFFFPLPADASLSRLAMYVNGELMEGGMAEREYARTVFEQIVTKMKDPALLEWVDGRTFKMRVFPLEPRQEKRIILSYTQRLPNLYGRLSYRFPAGHSLGTVRDWSFHARVKNGAAIDWHCDSHTLTPRVEGADLLLDAGMRQAAMDRDIVLDWSDQPGAGTARFSTAEQDGYRYLMLRYRPNLPGKARRQRRDWVFLFESSADRDPLLARTQIEVIRTLLANAEHDDTFAILTADTQVRKFTPVPLSATPENIAAALAFLERAHLLGALDLDAGLTAAGDMLRGSRDPVLVHLGSGQAVLGERRADVLASRIPAGACYVGVGIGKRWAQDFMRRAAERCQGYVTQINPDESVAWRAFDLLATLNTPRLLRVQVADPAGKAQFLCPSSILAQGEELCAIARLPAGAPLPKSIRITGTLDGGPFQSELTVESPRPGAAYLPRTWARLEIDRLLAEDAAKNKGAIIALSKAMYVMTPYTSLLVLENEAMYAQYKVDRGRKDHWAMYPCPQKIPVISEPLENQPIAPIVLEPPGLERIAQAMQSDEQLQERIRQENRERMFDSGLLFRMVPYIETTHFYSMKHAYRITDGTSNTIFITEPAQKVFMSDGSVRLINPPKDWNLWFDPITRWPLYPLGGSVQPPMFRLDADASPAPLDLDPESAERLLTELLSDRVQAKRASLWRQAARVAEQRMRYEIALQRLERALQLEDSHPRSLDSLRRDCAWFLSLALKRVKELIVLRQAVPHDLLDRVMGIADRWRAVDPADWIPCDLAGRILRLAGERELAWGYLTTPAALSGGAATGWLELARQQHWERDYDLAERAFAVASSLDPSNTEIISERALNHRAAGRGEADRKVLDPIETDW
jgi:hypothetical protein